MRESTCCEAKVDVDSDICSCCGNHCSIICELCGGEGWVEIIDKSKVYGDIIDEPYEKVICPDCDGSGETEAKY